MRGDVGCVGVLQAGGEWWCLRGIWAALGPRRKITGSTGVSPEEQRPPTGPGINSVGVLGDSVTPRGTHGGTRVSL